MTTMADTISADTISAAMTTSDEEMTSYEILQSWKRALIREDETRHSEEWYTREGAEAFRMIFERGLPWEDTTMTDARLTTDARPTTVPITVDDNVLLALAIRLAVNAHGDQLNQDGTPYILHPIRLMMAATSPRDQIVAVLHDTIEDTDLTLDKLRELGFPEMIVNSVETLTKREGEEYEAFIYRLSFNPIAVRVKLLDLYDNIDLTRLSVIGAYELQRAGKYHRAIQFLKGFTDIE